VRRALRPCAPRPGAPPVSTSATRFRRGRGGAPVARTPWQWFLQDARARRRLTLRRLHERLPAREHGLELLTLTAVRRHRVDVGPVVGEELLQLGHRSLLVLDLGLEPCELARAAAGLRVRRLWGRLRLRLRWRGGLRGALRSGPLVAAAHVV